MISQRQTPSHLVAEARSEIVAVATRSRNAMLEIIAARLDDMAANTPPEHLPAACAKLAELIHTTIDSSEADHD